jgi:hypothetical protein
METQRSSFQSTGRSGGVVECRGGGVIYLDTHAVVWLYEKRIEEFSSTGQVLINQEALLISLTGELELQYFQLDPGLPRVIQ